jgi:hypothetical protein
MNPSIYEVWSQVVVCSYCTPGPYEREMDRLWNSVKRFPGLQYHFHVMDPFLPYARSWVDAVLYKPLFILDCLDRFAGKPVLFVDADAILKRDPRSVLPNTWLPEAYCVPAVSVYRHRPSEPCSGTVVCAPVVQSKRVIQAWLNAQSDGPLPNQPQRVLNRVDNVNMGLGVEWCWIFDICEKRYPGRSDQAIIEHLQASREYRVPGREGASLDRRRTRLAEIDGR